MKKTPEHTSYETQNTPEKWQQKHPKLSEFQKYTDELLRDKAKKYPTLEKRSEAISSVIAYLEKALENKNSLKLQERIIYGATLTRMHYERISVNTIMMENFHENPFTTDEQREEIGKKLDENYKKLTNMKQKF